jgi:biotin carboxyl carrier protein
MNWQRIEQLVGLIDEHPISEITVGRDGARVTVRKALAPAPARPAVPPPAAPASHEAKPAEAVETEEVVLVRARMVGLFHHAKSPVRFGATIAPGQVVGNIESMKLMNEVTAESGGRVAEVLIEDGAPVEYGQPLFRLGA